MMYYYLDGNGFLTETTTEHPEWQGISHGEYEVLKARRAEEARVVIEKKVEKNRLLAVADSAEKEQARIQKVTALAEKMGVSAEDLLEVLNG